jgi:protein ImuB
MLWICLLLPELPLEVFLRAQRMEVDNPLRFAVASGGHQPRIVAANEAARTTGISAGQLVSAALALAPDVVLKDRDPAAEHAALEGVATWLTQFTPMVSLAPPRALLAEIGGSVRLFGGLRPLLQRIVRGIAELGYGVHPAGAPTPTAARALAHAGRRAIVRPEALEHALAPLPLVHLGADDASVALLRTAGIGTFGAAWALPRDALARRVGAGFVALLDRARNRVPDPQVPFVPPARYRGRLELPVPVGDTEALGFAVNRLVHELAGWLEGRGLGVLSLSLALEHERCMSARAGTAATTLPFTLAAPARDPVHLMTVLRERLARVALPAPVESLVLASDATAPLAGRNLGLLPGDDARATVPLLDRLRARLGEDAITCIAALEDHRPERAWRGALPAPATQASPVPHCVLPAGARPAWLLSEPQPLAATFEARPWILRDGPERIESGWWDGADIRRDYYVAESPRGEVLWIYRDSVYGEDGEWFLHGMFA